MKNKLIIILSIIIIILILQIANMDKQIKTKDEIIETYTQLTEKHKRELELYGDFIIGVVKGDDRLERLTRPEVLETGEKLMEIKKEVEALENKLK